MYQYPFDPISGIDPLGLNGWNSLGDGGIKEICMQVGSAVNYLPQSEAVSVIRNVETMHNVYNPLSEYVFGWSVAPGLVGMVVVGGEVPLAERASGCITDMANSAIVDGNKDSKQLVLTCIKGAADIGFPNVQKKMYDFVFDNFFSYSQKQ